VGVRIRRYSRRASTGADGRNVPPVGRGHAAGESGSTPWFSSPDTQSQWTICGTDSIHKRTAGSRSQPSPVENCQPSERQDTSIPGQHRSSMSRGRVIVQFWTGDCFALRGSQGQPGARGFSCTTAQVRRRLAQGLSRAQRRRPGGAPTRRAEGVSSAPVSEPGRFAPISLTNQHRIHLRESSGRVRGGPLKASRWLGRPAESWSEARPEPTLRP